MRQKNRELLDNTFVIGDVHGCYHTLQSLIKQFPKDAKLIFVGDLCDKGDYSNQVIEFVKSNNFPSVKGNHEHLYEKYILDACQNNIHSPWSSDKRYGGWQTIQSYNGDLDKIKEHLAWIKELPTYLELGKYFITHGFALEFYKQKDKSSSYNDFLLNRLYEDTIEPKIDENIINIFGHCPFPEVRIGEKYICLDTGCSKGGKLSAYSLGEEKIYEEPLDTRDSSYKVKELKLKHIQHLDLIAIDQITLQDGCAYASYDLISNEVLAYIVENYPSHAKKTLLSMKERCIIFPKQVDKFLHQLKFTA
jgi:serine/threonine protein phosphatase 1